MSAAWIDAPRGLVALSYVAVGCAATEGLPQMLERMQSVPLLLLGLGGLLDITGGVGTTLRPKASRSLRGVFGRRVTGPRSQTWRVAPDARGRVPEAGQITQPCAMRILYRDVG